ncbi:MAG TPA: hypothetical protein VF540_04860, partial [Segetibacter sp.]
MSQLYQVCDKSHYLCFDRKNCVKFISLLTSLFITVIKEELVYLNYGYCYSNKRKPDRARGANHRSGG